jgi:hypothetical protein
MTDSLVGLNLLPPSLKAQEGKWSKNSFSSHLFRHKERKKKKRGGEGREERKEGGKEGGREGSPGSACLK